MKKNHPPITNKETHAELSEINQLSSNSIENIMDEKELNPYMNNINTDFFVSDLNGSLDVCDEKGIGGWAIDEYTPGVPVEIDIIIDDQLVAKTIAGIFRQDLFDSGIGNGACAFYTPMPDRFFDNKKHSIKIKSSLSNAPLTRSTISEFYLSEDEIRNKSESIHGTNTAGNQDSIIEAQNALVRTAPTNHIHGVIEQCNEKGILGWALDENYPNAPLNLSIYIDNELTGNITANLFRQDLADASIGNGHHGFNAPIPNHFFDGKQHHIEIKDAFSNIQLSGCLVQTFLLNNPVHNPPLSAIIRQEEIDHLNPCIQAVRNSISTEFDTNFYLQTYPDIASAGVDPLEHYIFTGWQERRNPNPYFSTDHYLTTYNDAAEANINPLYHYVIIGKAKGYSTTGNIIESQPPSSSDINVQETVKLIIAAGLFNGDWYLHTNPDLNSLNIDPIIHYIQFGDLEGRNPNPYFDTVWYAKKYFKRAPSEGCLVHYITKGEQQGYKPCAIFDPSWYATEYGLKSTETNLLAHFIKHKSSNQFAPNAYFSPQYYLERYPDIASSGTEAFEHWYNWGMFEGRIGSDKFDAGFVWRRYMANNRNKNAFDVFLDIGQELGWDPIANPEGGSVFMDIRNNCNAGEFFEELSVPAIPTQPNVKAIAFYLPQFHPIAENDEWWGKGFTEWRNIPRGVPRFEGHYQPRVPRDFGYYELEGTAVMRQQVELARTMGLHGFCFYYYNFNGHRLLEKPLDAFIEDTEINFPFSLLWANENWSRRWDGMENDVLIRQDYKSEDCAALVDDLAKYLTHPNYIKADGRPILYLYRADIIPDCKKTIKQWRETFVERHSIDPIIVMAQAFGCNNPQEFGFDGAIEFPPHKLGSHLEQINYQLNIYDPAFSGSVRRYQDAINLSLSDVENPFPLIKTAFPMWDNDARKQGSGMCFHGSTPALFQEWVEGLIGYAKEKPFFGESFVFINAWNEWCEGTYLEPDCHYGYAYINALSNALHKQIYPTIKQEKIVLVGHDAFISGAQQLLLNIGKTLHNRFGIEISFVLMGDGDMVPAYEQVAPTYIASREEDLWGKLAEHINILKADGFRYVITNSLFSGAAAGAFADFGFSVCSLIHELPNIVREHHGVHFYEAIRDKSHSVVFPNKFVHNEITREFDEPANKSIVRSQGLYKKLSPANDARQAVRKELKLKPTDRLVINIGHGDLRKGIDIFVAIADQVSKDHDNIHFIWLGSQHPNIISWIARDLERRKNKNVHLIPFTMEVATYIAASDLFFLSSREDPFPSVVLEALALGLPVATFDWGGGYVELLDDKNLGLCIPYLDVNAAAHLIPEALNDPENFTDEKALYRKQLMAERYYFPDYCADVLDFVHPQRKRVSIVVPNYNYAHYMEVRLQSIFQQTYSVYEIIVLDDCSKDDSLKAIEGVITDSSRIVTVEANAVNSGNVFRQWKKGLEMAKGEYLWIAEADDLSAPNFLAEMICRLSSTPDSSFAFCDSVALDEKGDVMYDNYKGYYSSEGDHGLDEDGVFNAKEFLKRFLVTRNLVLNVSSVVWRTQHLRDVFDSLGDAAFKFTCAGDWRVYVESCRVGGTVHYAAETLNKHRRHNASVTHALSKPAHFNEIVAVQEAALQDFPDDETLAEAVLKVQADLKQAWELQTKPIIEKNPQYRQNQ